MIILSKEIYRLNAISIKIPMAFLKNFISFYPVILLLGNLP